MKKGRGRSGCGPERVRRYDGATRGLPAPVPDGNRSAMEVYAARLKVPGAGRTVTRTNVWGQRVVLSLPADPPADAPAEVHVDHARHTARMMRIANAELAGRVCTRADARL